MATNTSLGFLITTVSDIPRMKEWSDWLRLPLTLFASILTLRNIFVSVYEFTMDSTSIYPILNPKLLNRLRAILDLYPRGLVTITTTLHTYFSILLFLVCGRS